MAETFKTSTSWSTNQYSLNSLKLLNQRIRKLCYKTLGASLIPIVPSLSGIIFRNKKINNSKIEILNGKNARFFKIHKTNQLKVPWEEISYAVAWGRWRPAFPYFQSLMV